MLIHDDLTPALANSIVTLGSFDGFHRGHQALVSEVIERARVLGVPSVVMTFRPHPVQVLFPEKGFRTLAPVSDTAEQLKIRGVDHLIVKNFTAEFAAQEAEVFFDRHLAPLQPRAVVVGYDFAFGSGQRGNAASLAAWGRTRGFEVAIVPPLTWREKPVSSTRIREALLSGDAASARAMLGRPFTLSGRVERGAGRGKGLGIPTANLACENEIVPKSGVYLSRVRWRDRHWPAITNVGFNPTFGGVARVKVESHVLAPGVPDLYGEPVRVEILEFVREERRFASAAELIAQIQVDIAGARRYFESYASMD